jgi:hypothetical protein
LAGRFSDIARENDSMMAKSGMKVIMGGEDGEE